MDTLTLVSLMVLAFDAAFALFLAVYIKSRRKQQLLMLAVIIITGLIVAKVPQNQNPTPNQITPNNNWSKKSKKVTD